MKYAIIFLTMFLTNVVAKAESCTEQTSAAQVLEQAEIKTDVPNFLKGAKILVKLADGRQSEVPAEKFKVVPRLQQYLVTKVSNSTVRSCSTTVVEHKNNRVSALAGYGATGHLDRSANDNTQTVESSRGVLGGAMYQRLLNDHWSLGAQIQGNDLSGKNKTGLGVLGYEF